MTLLALLVLAAIRTPEECVVLEGRPAVTVAHGGRTYPLRHAECRDEFLTDPERYAQLYDALLEIHAAGRVVEPEKPSLVPS